MENAKSFLIDSLTFSGFFSEEYESDTVEKTSQHYGLEAVDGLFILDTIEEVLADKKEQHPETEE